MVRIESRRPFDVRAVTLQGERGPAAAVHGIRLVKARPRTKTIEPVQKHLPLAADPSGRLVAARHVLGSGETLVDVRGRVDGGADPGGRLGLRLTVFGPYLGVERDIVLDLRSADRTRLDVATLEAWERDRYIAPNQEVRDAGAS